MVIGERLPVTAHRYLSTGCYHASVTDDPAAVPLFHERCRRTCDWCRALCTCDCHKGEPNDLAQ